MTAEKASTLRLLREGIGQSVNVTDSRDADLVHELRAHLPDCPESKHLPILFLITSLAFLEAQPMSGKHIGSHGAESYNETDGWLPADFVFNLRRGLDGFEINLGVVRGRQVETHVSLSSLGELRITTQGRGRSATRWVAFVRGQTHLQQVNSAAM